MRQKKQAPCMGLTFFWISSPAGHGGGGRGLVLRPGSRGLYDSRDRDGRRNRVMRARLSRSVAFADLAHWHPHGSNLEKDFDKLVNDNKKYNSNINEAKQEVIELQGALTNHQKLISESSAQGLTNATATEDMDKLVKSTEKDLKKAEKSQSDYEKKIQENQNDQKDKTSEIEAQKKKVAEVQTKLDNIK